MTSYKTALGESFFTQSILKSKFIGYLLHVKTPEQAIEFINTVRKKHSDATHNCYGYILKDGNLSRYSDDGEPSGTAGLPIYEVIKGNGLMNVAIVVTRYFGGTLLGTGGLVRAYSSSAKGVIDSGKIVTMEQTDRIKMSFDYKYLDPIKAISQKSLNIKIETLDYSEKITAVISIRNNDKLKVITKITDITSNNFVICSEKSDYFPW